MSKLGAFILAALIPFSAHAQDRFDVRTVEVTEWKAVFGRIEARDRVPARARLGGTIVAIEVVEGSAVAQGQKIATVVDEKLALQLGAADANLAALRAQLENAQAELTRGENLLSRGVITAQRLDQLRTQVDVIEGQIGSAEAERRVLTQREAEGAVLAPIPGTVLDVPLTEGSVVMPGEVLAEIGGGGFFLRLAVPERHADFLEEGARIHIEGSGGDRTGTLAKVYPLIENGRVIADVEVEGLSTDFVDARVLVRLPVGRSMALLVPAESVETRMGLDFVTVEGPDAKPVRRTVVTGADHDVDGQRMVEVLSGLAEGERLVIGHE